MGIRDHSIYEVVYAHRKELRNYDMGGDSDHIGWNDQLSEDTWTVIAPTAEVAEAWAKRRVSFYKDGKVQAVNLLSKIDAFIEEHTW